ncbi:NUDIX hydrolase [Tuberibacillus sp. Marseille-P3662]|uniref:NUDIX hydrolase n=1 Tax=Tuberibacillus sp. Marseille-P3662 TaxID=1965358 RepID=UPI000A1CE2CE|nr:NUDIX hydrolase [Tuberibacillus sp. Marseille-P3662]
MSDLTEKTIQSKDIYQGKVINLQVDDVELPDGGTSKRELVKHPGAVAVIAVTKDGRLVLVRQYRKALEKTIYEIPAGKLEPGEAPEVTARRELAEETGFQCDQLEPLVSFYTSPGFADELVHVFYTDTLTDGEQQLDDDEFLDQHEVTVDEALQMIAAQTIHDAKTVYAVQYLQLKKHI